MDTNSKIYIHLLDILLYWKPEDKLFRLIQLFWDARSNQEQMRESLEKI